MKWNTSIKIAEREIKNRIVFPAITGNWAYEDGSVTERIIGFYQEIAEGGPGMIVVSGTAVTPQGKSTDRSLCLCDKSQLPGFKRLAETIKYNSCFASIQLMHVGGQGNREFTGHTPVSPSGIKCNATGFDSTPLSIEEIENISNMFINSALLAHKAGFEAIELHLAHGYLLHEFLSEHTNKRNDKYGGNISKRAELVLDIIAGIKRKAPDLIIGTRVSGEDFIESGINEEINKRILPLLQEAGVEYFSVTAGIYDTSQLKHKAMSEGRFFNYANNIMRIVSKPVIGVGKILDPEMAEAHINRGDCDMVAIGRGLIADPMMVKKTINNQEIERCTECGQCQFLRHGEKEMNCSVRNTQYA